MPLRPFRTRDKRLDRRQRPQLPVPVQVFLGPAFRGRPAELADLSPGGAGLLFAEAVEPGALLFIRLPANRQGVAHTHAARVAHRTPLTAGGWLVGCRWVHRLAGARVRWALGAPD